ncbi:TlyA family RNA methyltransferase [Aestuariimicrobium ganziense]|uniref:TlyA family RNA methyltransferase n=1 Tax=Aestuariimicrobium ganziense TaxID=2773677 RepID=UPI001943224F|nr:TlyA family RNA methyltransferase [Aestuariimicrobium ganziense]
MAERLDLALVRLGLARSRSAAQGLVREGRVRVNGTTTTRSSHQVNQTDRVDADVDPWVSRAAHKLIGALDDLHVDVPATCLDAGASTGGFTQVLLSRGATLVHAFDVGHAQLAPVLRDDPRVRSREGFNLRELGLADLGDTTVDLVVADLSFISLTLVVEPLLSVLDPNGTALLMVKPQFEVGREALGAGGVVDDPVLRRQAIEQVVMAVEAQGWRVVDQAPSRLPGPSGNLEHFLLCRHP